MFEKKKKKAAAGSGFLGFTAVAMIFGILAITLGACTQEPDTKTGTNTAKAASPVADPTGGNYSAALLVRLSSATEGAAIHYTTDGSTPTASSALYTGGITVSISTSLKAIAVRSGMANSDVMTEEYTLPFTAQAATPVANPPGGTYSGSQLVTLSCATEGAIIYYTTDGSNPIISTSSALYTGGISIGTGTTTLRAIAVYSGMASSEVRTAVYGITIANLGPLTEAKWLDILMDIATNNTFNGLLDLSGYSRSSNSSGGGLRSDGTFDPLSGTPIGKDKIVTLILPNTATEIAAGTSTAPSFSFFANLESFSGAMLATSGTYSIGSYAFAGCTKLAVSELPVYLVSIGNNAFQDCTSLTQITLSANLTTISSSAFQGCTNLVEVTSLRTTPPALGANSFSGTDPNLVIRVPAESVAAYRAAWSQYEYHIIAIGSTPAITINTQPAADTILALSSISGSLSVAAAVTPSAFLRYQWYSNTTNSNDGGTAISNAASSSYTIPTNLQTGIYYYFCEVRAAGAEPVRSSVATVNVVVPEITINTQPEETINVDWGNISGSLSVEASVSPAGPVLSYQWYTNTENSNNSGTSLGSGARNTSFTIPTNLAGGTYYYFCEVRATGAENVRSSVAAVNVFITVTFDTRAPAVNNPVSITGLSVLYDMLPALTLPSIPEGAAVAFNGWWTSATGGTQVKESNFITVSLTLYAHWTFTAGTYTIGSLGEGTGRIFYIADGQAGRTLGFTVEGYTDGTGSYNSYIAYYLEAGPQNSGAVNSTQWGGYGIYINGVSQSRSSIIGNGRKDTLTIVAYLAENTNETDRATQLAAAANFGGKNDWFLPSFGELNQLYINRDAVGIGSTGRFWSSLQANDLYAWPLDFSIGSEIAWFYKYQTATVRAIRAF